MFLNNKSFVCTLFILVFLLACANKKQVSSQEKTNLLDTSWQLSAWPGSLPSDITITLQFEKDRVNGKGVCNNYFSDYQINGKTIVINNVGATKKMCPAHNDKEIKYFDLLEGAQNITVSKNQLTIHTKNGDLRFDKINN